MKNAATSAVDDYIGRHHDDVQRALQRVRRTIAKAAPEADECIGYGIPTFKLRGNLVHFAAWERHIGFYPGPSGIEKFKKDLAPYKSSKGAVQFPIGEPVPADLIAKIVKFRVAENAAKAAKKRKPARKRARAG
jgi:uncharacterized protein YdhG (YjbR/CyaY superfamily)